MSTGRQTVRGLVEEGKKRVVLLLVCVFGLSYLMSLTSSSVWVNLPAAASLIICLRYISLDLDVRRRSSSSNRRDLLNKSSRGRSIELPAIPVDKLSWRRKVNLPVVEAAIDQFTRHLVSEWVTDLWYSRITPDKDGPEELVQIMNDVLGEVSCRARDINLINLLTRDIIDLFCSHLDLYRSSQGKIGKEELLKLSIDDRDAKLKLAMAEENRLHTALASVEAEHKVLQDLVSGLISLTFKPESLQCSYFRITVREILACAVLRPVLNFANPRFINEKIESLVISLSKKTDGFTSSEGLPRIRPGGLSRASVDQLPGSFDHSNAGVELVQFKNDNLNTSSDEKVKQNSHESKNHRADTPTDEMHPFTGGEWAHMLDVISTRKTRALAPEHFENMWTKGRNYKRKEDSNWTTGQVGQGATLQADGTLGHSKVTSNCQVKVNISKTNHMSSQYEDQEVRDSPNASSIQMNGNHTTHASVSSFQEKIAYHLNQDDAGVDSESSYETDDDDSNNVTGLNSPGTRIWDSKNKRNSVVSHIRHPLESFEINSSKRTNKNHSHHSRIMRSHSVRKRSRSSNQKFPVWQEDERTSSVSSDRHDILNLSKVNTKKVDVSDESETESWGRVHSGSTASSSLSNVSLSEDCRSLLKPSENFVIEESFLKLRCEVLGANIVKSGSGTFAVYSISVSDESTNNSWSIKRRFRHFEELHRRLKEFSEYNLHLPPKHFLSSGLEVPVIKERCKLLDKYLKMLLQLPSVSESIEAWDFLSVDSQTYIFSDSFSIIQTLSVDLDDKSSEKGGKLRRTDENVNDHLRRRKEHLRSINEGSSLPSNTDFESDTSVFKKTNAGIHLIHGSRIAENQLQGNLGGQSEVRLPENNSSVNSVKPVKVAIQGDNGQQDPALSLLEPVTDPTIPIEWAPPNLSMPILDLVDAVFQLQDGGWMRRQVFWIAKQVLQLGMGDAFDDWLIEKVQLLRQGSVVAHAIKRVEQILWPDGIFITKHPSRRRPTPVPSPKEGCTQKENVSANLLTEEEQVEASRRAKFVHELIIEKAPAALVGLVGRKEYERCAEDVYFFLQSSLCLRQLAIELLELLLLAAFPELDDVVRRFHQDKEWRTRVVKGK